jgi:hypothetical protein
MKHIKSFSQFQYIKENKMDDIGGKRHQINEVKDIKDFIFAGNAIFTIESTRTGKWFTYEVNKPKDSDNLFFVGVLRGPDNTSSYSYIGLLSNRDNPEFRFIQTGKSKFTKLIPDPKGEIIIKGERFKREDSTCVKAFKFFYKNLMENKLHEEMNFYHMGYCGRCGRTLTVPESVARGIGPVCATIPDKTKQRAY